MALRGTTHQPSIWPLMSEKSGLSVICGTVFGKLPCGRRNVKLASSVHCGGRIFGTEHDGLNWARNIGNALFCTF
jgi:hypothetical protein